MNANDPYAEFPSPGEVRLVRHLPGPIEKVWDYLTDPEKRGRWFAGGPMEPRRGGAVRFFFHHRNLAPSETPPDEYKEVHDPGAEMAGVVTRWEPPRVLAFTLQESEVTFELSPEGKGVLLVLSHRARGGDLPHVTNFSAGWHTHLAHLSAELEGTPRPPFWPLLARLESDYVKRYAAAHKS
jgi:uncharacterized protein YndB with AHSA1/START domain